MIIEYHRPQTIDEAINLLRREGLKSVPLGGGTVVNQPSDQPLAVVDLQSLGLDRIEQRGKDLVAGATSTLQALLEHPDLPPGLRKVIELEATYNLRQVATLAGTLVAAGGRSPLATALLALDVQLTLLPGEEVVSLGDFLPTRTQILPGRLVSSVKLPLGNGFAFHTVARTPADQPIVCAAVARWRSGRTRLALGGYGPAPVMVFDGPEAEGVETAARSAYAQASDEWASAEYRVEVAAVLARRCLQDMA